MGKENITISGSDHHSYLEDLDFVKKVEEYLFCSFISLSFSSVLAKEWYIIKVCV